MERFQLEQDRLDKEQEESHEEYEKMKAVFEKKIQLYNQYLTQDDLTDVGRLMLSNRREWAMSHMLSLIIDEETTNKLSELAKRVYELEKRMDKLEEYNLGSYIGNPQN